ncbi:MAG: hypothetical protein BWK80_42325 [Desulfobacteraceae bacterium IS3]|nr:MAG: hypothetical protein BWK80_42325 [Desulfobacteraceae bacterium IS3]
MSVYMIIETEVRDKKLYAEYVEKVPAVIEKYGGRHLARDGKITSLSGNWHPERIILLKFETAEALQKCFNSSEYLEIKSLREQSAVSKAIVVEGI